MYENAGIDTELWKCHISTIIRNDGISPNLGDCASGKTLSYFCCFRNAFQVAYSQLLMVETLSRESKHQLTLPGRSCSRRAPESLEILSRS